MRYILIILLSFVLFSNCNINKKEVEKITCNSDALPVVEQLELDSNIVIIEDSTLLFLINVYTDDTIEDFTYVEEYLNDHFYYIGIQFEFANVQYYDFPDIDVLSDDGYLEHSRLSKQLDYDSVLSMWIVEQENICSSNGIYTTCSKTGGWAYINNNMFNNIVINKIDLNNFQIVVHEFGHFFGLQHTFYSGLDGDGIDDTPFDPNEPIYVGYGDCQLHNGMDTPIINNFMSYYNPCLLKDYMFTKNQYSVMYNSAWRRKLYLAQSNIIDEII